MKKRAVILSVIIFLLIGGFLFFFFFDKEKEEKPMPIKLNFENRTSQLEEFYEENTIKIGWLQVQGTNVDLPVLIAGIDSEIDHDTEYAWRSWNYNSDGNREVITSHNYLNLSSKPSTNMSELNFFEGLMGYAYPDFALENQYIYYLKDGVEELYVIYAVGFYDNYYDSGESYMTKEEVDAYIEKVRDNSLYDYDIEVTSEDELLTLKTCTRYFGSEKLQQFVVDARKVRVDEETVRYPIETTNKYKELIEEEKIDNSEY